MVVYYSCIIIFKPQSTLDFMPVCRSFAFFICLKLKLIK